MSRGIDNERRWKKINLSLYPGDLEMCDYLQKSLGYGSRSEVIRAALRAYSMHIETLTRARD